MVNTDLYRNLPLEKKIEINNLNWLIGEHAVCIELIKLEIETILQDSKEVT